MKGAQGNTEGSSSDSYYSRGRWNIAGLAGSAVSAGTPFFGFVANPIIAGAFYGASAATAIYSIATKNDDMSLRGYVTTGAGGAVAGGIGSACAAPIPTNNRGGERFLATGAARGATVGQIESALCAGTGIGIASLFFRGNSTPQTVLTEQYKTSENSKIVTKDAKPRL